MNPNRFATFFCLLVFTSVMTQGQSPYPNTLLWRISGKGMQEPSYLYGTLHLNDKRLFSFGDSVYRAIEGTKGLAIEVNPDEMGAYFVNRLFDQMAKSNKLKDVLDEKYFAKNRKALAKKFGKPAEEIGAADVIKEKNKWMSEYMQKGEMPTFMDAYLYNIARRQGKWLGGVEDIGDQAGLIEGMIDQSDIDYLLATDDAERGEGSHRGIESMISLYLNQDLEGIYAFSSEGSTAVQKDRMLIHRNVKMARRIDSLTHLRTMFIAIGSAHLAGDSGVIRLLRDRGFTVTPVMSKNRIASSDYSFKEVHLPWVTVTDGLKSYTAEMPANPATVKLYGIIEMKFLMDLFNMSGFCTMAVVNSSHSNKDSLYNIMAEQMLKEANAKPTRNLEKNGLTGKEFIKAGGEGNLRVQIFISDKMVYLALLSSLKKEVLSSADAEKFFNSFTIHPYKEDTAHVVRTFSDPVMGVRFDAPVEILYNEKLSTSQDEAWKISCFTGVDPGTGAYIMLFSKEVKAGYRIPSDSIINDALYKRLEAQYSDIRRKDSIIGNSRLVQLSGTNIANPGLFLDAFSIVRNGRQILLMMIGSDPAIRHSAGLERVFQSFHFIAQPSVAWRKSLSPDGNFSSWAPSPFRVFISKSDHARQWVSYDTTTATSFQVVEDTAGKYSWYLSDSVFWKEEMRENVGIEHLLDVKDVTNGELHGKELLVKRDRESSNSRRVRILVCGDKVYKLFVTGGQDLLYSKDVNSFFDSFRTDGAGCGNSLTVSKAALLLHDLGSPDSATRRNAHSALIKAPFVKADAQLLREALFRTYQSPYGAFQATFINFQLATLLARLKDPMTLAYIRSSYDGLRKEKSGFQNTALFMLAQQHTTDSYALLAELLRQGPTAENLGFRSLFALKDSLDLTATLFPSFDSWARGSLQSPGIAYITMTLLDSGYLTQEAVAQQADRFIDAAKELLPTLSRSDVSGDMHMKSLIKLIGRCHTSSSYALLQSYLTVKNKSLLNEVVLQLVNGGQAVPAAVLNRLAADPVQRTVLYSDLKKSKKASLFPLVYRTQAYFAESAVYQAINDEDEDEEGIIEKLVFLSKRTAMYHGMNYTWYLYKVSLQNDEGTRNYLGIAGGYDLSGAGLEPKKELSGIYRKEEYDGAKVQSFFSQYLKSMDKDEEE